MSNIIPFQPTPQQIEEATKKGNSWKDFGYNMALMETYIIHQATPAPWIPQNENDIQKAEEELTRLKELRKSIETERKNFTGTLDKLNTRLMNPEKQIDSYIKMVGDALLQIKQNQRQQEQAKADKERRLQDFRQKMLIEYNNMIGTIQRGIVDRVNQAYIFALDNVSVHELDIYLNERIAKLTPESQAITALPLTGDAELDAITKEVFSQYNPQSSVDYFRTMLMQKFSDFVIAKQNSDAAKQRAAKELQETNQQIQQQNDSANASASLQTSVDVIPTQTGKALKDFFELDMEHNQANAILIMQAFVSNNGWSLIQVKDVFNLKIEQMGAALCKMKNDDNNFAPQGIIFKPVTKL